MKRTRALYSEIKLDSDGSEKSESQTCKIKRTENNAEQVIDSKSVRIHLWFKILILSLSFQSGNLAVEGENRDKSELMTEFFNELDSTLSFFTRLMKCHPYFSATQNQFDVKSLSTKNSNASLFTFLTFVWWTQNWF